MNAKIYTGKNALENWLIDLRAPGSATRSYTRLSNPENIQVTSKTSMEAAKGVSEIINKSTSQSMGTWEQRGYWLGATAGATVYSFTYPVTFIDGPLPIVDVAWAFGLIRFTRATANLGAEIGSWID